MILVIPSIDLRGGKCARLVAAEPGARTVYSDDPIQTAILWRGENAKMLHVADLDGAAEGEMKNIDVVRGIINAVDIPIQASGGVRTYEQVRDLFEVGASRVVVSLGRSTDIELVERLISEFGPRRIVVAVDSKPSTSASDQRQEEARNSTIAIGKSLKLLGVERALFADTSRDGTLSGPNFDAIGEFAAQTKLKVTASGGISGYPDLRRMQDLEAFGVDSVIIGRALYENRFPCQELWRKCEATLTDLGPTRRV